MRFADRIDAGKKLAEKFTAYDSSKDSLLVVGLPRGGVPLALVVAHRLNCPLEVMVAKKLPFPGHAEFAIGAVSSDGTVVLNADIPQTQAWKTYIEAQRLELLKKTRGAEEQFYALAQRQPSSFKGKTAIIVDDGIATGMTAAAALQSARKRGAKKVIMAAPVMSRESYTMLQPYCDEIVSLLIPDEFHAVGLFYADFSQTSDEEVIEALRHSPQITTRAVDSTLIN